MLTQRTTVLSRIRIQSTLLSLFFLVSLLLSGCSTKQYNVVNDISFKDDHFKECVLSYDEQQLNKFNELECSNSHITSADEIRFFPAIESLDLSNNQLTTLDVTNNTLLKTLYLPNNNLKNLDVSANPLLEFLYAYNNQLSEIDLTHSPLIKELILVGNQLHDLNITANTVLIDLLVYANALTELDISKNTQLEYLQAEKNQIDTLNISHNPNLSVLRVDPSTKIIGIPPTITPSIIDTSTPSRRSEIRIEPYFY
ncbi:leucine-rich repeat domain-containing protein [Photobacterium indicum]|uniref:leucine-rich repeat domain-containing protein n=1 Tax=Photobacterium indicum TaxID=81447 RepID=UPI003D0A4479